MKATFRSLRLDMLDEVSSLEANGMTVDFRVTTDGLQRSELVITSGDETRGEVAVPAGVMGVHDYRVAVGERILLSLPGGNLTGRVAYIQVAGRHGALGLDEVQYEGSAGSLDGGQCASCYWDFDNAYGGEVETSAWDKPVDWHIYREARTRVINSGHFYGHPEANREALRLVIGELIAIDNKLYDLAEKHGLLRASEER